MSTEERTETYRRWTGSKRGEARRNDLLEKVTADLAANGLVDFSLRRAARAAGTTHKVLLYYFEGPDELLAEALFRLRDRRAVGLRAVTELPAEWTLSRRLREVWPRLVEAERDLWVITQSIGLLLYDPERYRHLGRDLGDQYHDVLIAMCPPAWSAERKEEIAALMVAVFRGLLLDARARGTSLEDPPAIRALLRMLEREEALDTE